MTDPALQRLVRGMADAHAMTHQQLPGPASEAEIAEVVRFARESYGFSLPEDLLAVWRLANGLASEGAYLWPIHERRGAPFAVQGVIETNLTFREIDEPAQWLFFVGDRDDVDNYVFNLKTRTWQRVDPYCWVDASEDEYDSFSAMMLPIFTDLLGREGIDISETGPYA